MRAWLSGAAAGFMVLVAATAGDLGSKENADYLAANAKRTGVVTLPGLQYEILKSGNGGQPGRYDCVTVRYKGSLIDGKVFDESAPGNPATFLVSMLIPGWVEALQLMHEGDLWKLVVPPALAYGNKGTGSGTIPPDQTLVFEVELLKVSKPVNGHCS
jgi:FKBP-type peptidyl-prolyl cis-trans isomerase FklB